MLLYILVTVKRIRNEEAMSGRSLAGYTEYKQDLIDYVPLEVSDLI